MERVIWTSLTHRKANVTEALGMSGLIRILAVRHRNGIPERIFPKRTYFEKTSADNKKAWNINFLHSYMLGSRGVQFFF